MMKNLSFLVRSKLCIFKIHHVNCEPYWNQLKQIIKVFPSSWEAFIFLLKVRELLYESLSQQVLPINFQY